MKQLTRFDSNEVIGLAKMLGPQITAVTDSFHSLIGDFWVAGLTSGRIARNKTFRGHGQLQIMWDSEVPLVNPQTALAWSFICENDQRASRPRIVLPESIDPQMGLTQHDSFEECANYSPMLPVIGNLRARFSPDFHAVFRSANRQGPAVIYTITQNRLQITGMTVKLPRETDELRLTPKEIRNIALRRHALMCNVLTFPKSPTSQAAYWARGYGIRAMTLTGLAIKAQEEQQFFISPEQKIMIPGDAAKPTVAPDSVAAVPNMTMPLWMGFTLGTVKGKEAADEWMESYLTHRQSALAQLEAGLSLGVTNPGWEHTLNGAALVVGKPKPVPESKKTTTAKTNEFMDGLTKMLGGI